MDLDGEDGQSNGESESSEGGTNAADSRNRLRRSADFSRFRIDLLVGFRSDECFGI